MWTEGLLKAPPESIPSTMLVSLIVSAALASITAHVKHLIPLPALSEALNFVVGLAVSTALFSLTFKAVPDVKIAWRDVWVGGFVTALAFSVGKTLLAWYVGRSATVSPFGAAGSLVALIVWIYYSAQILFLGAEYARVYTVRCGSGIVRADNAMPLDASPQPPSRKRT